MAEKVTPMMKQFFDLKAKHPEALLLFRCGDFYETYCDDAIEAARILGITLTRRNNGSNEATAMAGFPYHALDTYLPKLIKSGRRVAICDQLEDPKLTKKLVKRGITELVTPGTAMQDNVLSQKENNFLASVHFGTQLGVALLDLSTGEFLVDEGGADKVQKLFDTFTPKEVLYDKEHRREFQQLFGTKLCVYELDEWVFTESRRLQDHFRVNTLKGYGIEGLQGAQIAAGAILQYLEYTQHTALKHITSIKRIDEDRYVRLDKWAAKSLELIAPLTEDGVSLLSVIDRTQTPMGGRLLKRWLLFPLKERREIELRLNAVDCFFKERALTETILDVLPLIGDMERIVSKVATGRVTPRDVVALKNALRATVSIKDELAESENSTLRQMSAALNCCDELCERIEAELNNDAPFLIAKGNIIKRGYNAELDELRDISQGGRDYLLDLQKRECENTGINSLKVGFNNVFGYYLEVRNTYREQVPMTWVRKQTLANAERYITEELKSYEEKILGADEKIKALEEQLFNELVTETQNYITFIQLDANIVSQIDCLLSFTQAAKEHHYVRPVIDESLIIDIKNGRHPVIETRMPVGEKYIPNDVYLDNKEQQIIVISGPNMSGKSAVLRQTVLITLLAQVGCFVPADSARIGIVDKVFTRIGASDNISQGESTFMVEMLEAANILNNVTNRSLVIFDELGRGTSTYDGISLAWAIVEYLHEQSGVNARTLFATHYHELNEMAKQFERVKNYNVSVKQVDNKVLFLRKLVAGGADRSFGINVAELVGMPPSILNRAKQVLKSLEQNSAGSPAENAAALKNASTANMQLSIFQLDDPTLSQVRDEILELDINNLTPIEALNKLHEIKKIVKG